ncbi:MAG: hypothetical protein MUC99_05390 [Anaerolineae bacterium]|nr:hypothetical protein [Anaerolineae bacterium]
MTDERRFDDLTLAEALREWARAPRRTWGALRASTRREAPARPVWVTATPAQTAVAPVAGRLFDRTAWMRWTLWLGAILAGILGCWVVAQPTLTSIGRQSLLAYAPVTDGLGWWLLAVGLAAAAEGVAWRAGRLPAAPTWAPPNDSLPFRVRPFLIALPMLAGGYFLQSPNQFTFLGVLCWVIGLEMLVIAFWPHHTDPRQVVRRWVRELAASVRAQRWVWLGLLSILALAAYMRAYDLIDIPAEMTSDHIEKLLDAQRVADGDRDIFFANNGGREPFQMYFLALISPLTGGLNFTTLKLAAAIESWLGVLVFFFLGRALGGEDTRRANLIGLAFAGVAAVGYWHLVVTRVSLRIMLTPLVTGLALLALVRLVRHNHRADALWAGMALGFGLYSYQALRLLPLVAFLAVVLGVLFIARTWRQRVAYAVNLLVMALITLAAFVPLLRFANDFPDDFWRRAAGRLLGDDIICDYNAEGGCVPRTPTVNERLAAFGQNLPLLGQNFVVSLGLFTYRGDITWLHNAPNYPALDPLAGGLMYAGLGGLAVWAVRRRDAVAVLMVGSALLMLVPSASAIANPIENPSNTRASGAMPGAYLLVGLGLVGGLTALGALLPRRWRQGVMVVVAAGVLWQSGNHALTVLRGPYTDFYLSSWSPEREVGRYMRGFVESGGAWGNVYLLSYAHFFDYRGVAITAGLPPGRFTQGDIPTDILPGMLRAGMQRNPDDPFRLDPERDLLIIFSGDDPDSGAILQRWFPTGNLQRVETRRDTPWLPSEPFFAFRVPAPVGVAIETLDPNP